MTGAVVVKLIGAFFKIPLTAIIGGDGMGYFMTAYGLFNPIYALSVAGFPVAVRPSFPVQSLFPASNKPEQEFINTQLFCL